MLVTLGEQQILKLNDFADLASDELTGGYDIVKGERVKIKGYLEDFALSKKEADELIMSARNKIYKGSKTSYADWCLEYGFVFADKVIPTDWITRKDYENTKINRRME